MGLNLGGLFWCALFGVQRIGTMSTKSKKHRSTVTVKSGTPVKSKVSVKCPICDEGIIGISFWEFAELLVFKWSGQHLEISSDIDDGENFRYEPKIKDKNGQYDEVTFEEIFDN